MDLVSTTHQPSHKSPPPLTSVMGSGFYFPNCQTCVKWKVGMSNLWYCGESNCSKVGFFEERNREWKDILKPKRVEKQKWLDYWDDNCEKEGGFTKEEWQRIRSQIDRYGEIPHDIEKFKEFIKDWQKQQKKQERAKKKGLRNTQDRHKDKYYQQNHYREEMVEMELMMRNWKLIKNLIQEEGKVVDNFLLFFFKKWCGKNTTYSSYIYKTSFFLYDTPTPMYTMGDKEDKLNLAELSIWRGIFF